MTTEPQAGGCLCGKVRYTLSTPKHEAGACHCSICRRWCGGPLFFLHFPGSEGAEITGEDALGWYESSDKGARGFCKSCGSNMFYKYHSGDLVIAAGTLDDAAGLSMEMQIFTEDQPAFYTLGGGK